MARCVCANDPSLVEASDVLVVDRLMEMRPSNNATDKRKVANIILFLALFGVGLGLLAFMKSVPDTRVVVQISNGVCDAAAFKNATITVKESSCVVESPADSHV